MEKMKWIKKGVSALLALNMVLSSVPLPAFAVTEDGSCDHAHDESCGYVAMVEGVDCGHECSDACKTKQVTGCTHNHETEGCTYTPAAEAVACDYVHGEGCNHVYAQDEVLCTCGAQPQHTAECASVLTEGADCDCTMPPVTHAEGCNPQAAVAESCDHVHGECAYREAVKESWNCGHVCSVETGCITFACAHVCLEDNCGFAAAVEGSDCEYVCSECDPQPDSGESANPTVQTVDFMDYLEDPLTVMFQSAEDIDLHDYLVNAYGVPAEIPFTCEPATVAYGDYADGDTFSLTVTAGEGYEGSCTVEAEVYHAGNSVDENSPCEMKIYIKDDATREPVKNVLITLKHKTRPNYANYDKVHEWTTDDDGGLQLLGYNVQYVYTDVLVEFAGNDTYPKQSHTIIRTVDNWKLQTATVYLKPYRSASVTVKNEHGEAVTDANVTVGGIRLNHQGNGVYSNSKAVYGSSQKLTITAPGYVGKEATVTVGANGYTDSYTLDCNEPDILVNGSAAGGTLNLPTGSTYALTFQNALPSGAQKSRSGTSSNHFSWVETGNGWNATPTTLTENGSLTFQYTHGENQTHTKTYSVKIAKGSTASPAAPTLSGNTNTVTTETFKLPADLKLATSLTITATGAVNKTQTFTGLTPGETLTMPLSNTSVKGTVTYQFSYKSDVVDYNTTPSASQSYTQTLTEEMFQLSWISSPYNGENQRPEVSVVSGAGISLDQCDIKYGCWVGYPWQEDRFFVEAGAIRPTPFTENVGEYNIPLITEAYAIQITAKEGSGYTGTVTLNYNIQKLKAGEVTPRLEYSETTYDGTAKTPKVWLECSGGKKLEIGTVSYGQNNTDAGTVNVSLSNYGDYIDGTINWQGSFKITQRPLWGKVTDVNKDYDGTNTKRATFSLENVADKDKNTITGSCDVIYTSENAGTYSITVENFSDSEQLKDNYYLDAEKITYPEKGTINPRPVTVTADAKSKTYGEADPELTYTVDNIVENETLTGINVSRGEGNTAGTYTITVTADKNANPNYAITTEGGTFTINPKPLTIDFNIQKQFDNTTKIDKNDTFQYTLAPNQVLAGDKVKLDTYTGTASFKSAEVGEYEVTFSDEFTISGKDAKNYTLTQPTGVTGMIYNTYNAVKGTDFTVSPDSWTNGKVTITAAKDCKLAEKLTDEWNDTLTYTEQATTVNGNKATFYVKKTNGDISKLVEVPYFIDQTAPTGTIALEKREPWKELVSNITFGLFYNYEQTVTITPEDTLSSVAKTEYLVSSEPLDQDKLDAATWTEYTAPIPVALEDTKQFVYYGKITDKAGNVKYLSTDGTVYDTTTPKITDVTGGETYYITKSITVTDTYLQSVTLTTGTGTPEEKNDQFELPGNVDTAYTITAVDKAGNQTTVSVTMKPIATLDDALDAGESPMTVDNVKLSNKAAIIAIRDQAEDLMGQTSVETEDVALQQIIDRMNTLLEAIAAAEAVIDQIENLPAADKAEPDSKEHLKALLKAQADYEALTDNGKKMVGEDNKAKLDAVATALRTYKIFAGDGGKYTKYTGKTLSFTANGPVKLELSNGKTISFKGILVDGTAVDAKNYTVVPGSTVVTLTNTYLDSLKGGKHTIVFLYDHMGVECKTNEASFRISIPSDNPKTGDYIDHLLWAGTAVTCLLCMAMMVMFIPRKKGKYER